VAASTVTDITPFTSVAKAQNACGQAVLQAGVTACFNGGSASACQMWQTANPTCAACAIPVNAADGGFPANNGSPGLLCIDNVGCFLNTDACVEILDGNTTCAQADEQLTACVYEACDSMTCLSEFQSSATAAQTDFSNCLQSASTLACATQNTAANSGCTATDTADGGTFEKCQAATVADVTKVLSIICNGNNAP
jgi:hypothetical protein